jgi:two-component system sensor histidine kinase BarA
MMGERQGRVSLGEILDRRSLTEVCAQFAELWRAGVVVLDTGGKPFVDARAEAALCAGVLEAIRGATLDEERPGTAVACAAGCTYLVRPVLLEGDRIARIALGPFLLEGGAARGHGRPCERFGAERAEQIVAHLGEIVDVLLHTGYKNLLTSRMHLESLNESYRESQEKSRRLENAYERLKELERMKASFLATMSHELRTPLTSIIGYSEIMLEGLGGTLTPEQRQYVGIIMEKGEALLGLLTTLLDMSKIGAGRVKVVASEVDPSLLIREAVAASQPLAQKKGIALTCRLPEGLPRARWDRDKIRQSLVNVLDNGLKFTASGGAVTVEAAPGPAGKLTVSVRDTGVGIPEHHLGRIFEMFYQVDGSTTREFGGAGLGLAIVKSYVEAHGGDVRAESRPGEGSVFHLELPLRPPEPLSSSERSSG